MSGSFEEVTNQTWFGKMGNALFGMLMGPLVMIGSCVLLSWNEGNSLYTIVSLDEAKKVVVEVADPAKLDAALDKKLVRVAGKADTNDILKDEEFAVESNAVRLTRKVEMFQWKEKSETREEKKLGGGTEKRTSYSYEKVWSTSEIDSSDFKVKDGHRNPGNFPVKGRTIDAPNVLIGAYRLSNDLLGQMNKSESVSLDADKVKHAPFLTDRPEAKVDGRTIYLGKDPSQAQVGDVRITFEQTPAADVTVLAQQDANGSFSAWSASNGYTVNRLYYGIMTAAQMIAGLETENTVWTWALRGIGTALMALGISMIFSPLVALADVIPMLGDFVSWGTGIFSLIIAVFLSTIVIAVAWLYYRPLWAIGLIAGAIALVFLVRMLLAKPRPPVTQMA